MELIKKAIIDYTLAAKYLRQDKLWLFLFLPGVISFILGALFFYLAYLSAGFLGEFLTSLYPFEFGKKAASTFFHYIPITYILGLMLIKYIIYIALSPFLSILSEKVEKKHTGSLKSIKGIRKNIKVIIRSTIIALRSLYKEILWTILFSIIGILIPIVGIIGIFITQAYYIGVGNMDFTMERYYKRKDSILWIKNKRGLALGNGIVYLTIFISIIGFFIAPTIATIAGTISVLDELKVNEK